jgi:hypothetical protein
MKKLIYSMVILVATFSASLAEEAKDIVIADFEGKDYGKWKVTGEAFGAGPAQGTLVRLENSVRGPQGE